MSVVDTISQDFARVVNHGRHGDHPTQRENKPRKYTTALPPTQYAVPVFSEGLFGFEEYALPKSTRDA